MIHVFISGSGMDWALSPLSRLLTVAYLIVGAPIMFMYLRTTGGAAARGLRYACMLNSTKLLVDISLLTMSIFLVSEPLKGFFFLLR